MEETDARLVKLEESESRLDAKIEELDGEKAKWKAELENYMQVSPLVKRVNPLAGRVNSPAAAARAGESTGGKGESTRGQGEFTGGGLVRAS
eukprot:286776-Prorocentrum_minimum.AAC.1